ncbi:AAEL002073-PA, partial [Aedes aegypti]
CHDLLMVLLLKGWLLLVMMLMVNQLVEGGRCVLHGWSGRYKEISVEMSYTTPAR